MDEHERLMSVALEIADEEHGELVHRGVSRIYIGGVPEHVLVVSAADIVGWLRIKDGTFVWRNGSFDRSAASSAVTVENPEVDPDELLEVLNGVIDEADQSRWPPPEPADGEAEEFVRSIENGQKPAAWSEGRNEMVQLESSPPPATSEAAPARLSGRAPAPPEPVKFNAYIHAKERNPAAPGLTEKDLDGIPLMTVYPAAIPAVIGAAFLTMATLGAQYEFYVVLRWAATYMAIWMSVVAGGQGRNWWSVVFVGGALLFNPFIPVTATREFWLYPDALGTVLFAIAGRKLRASRPATHNDRASF